MDIACGDGGGNKCWMGLSLWDTLKRNKFAIDGVVFNPKMFIGTSGWGMIGIALAQHQSSSYLLSRAEELANQIFQKNLLLSVGMGVFTPKYSASAKLKAVKSIIRESLPDDLPWGVTSYPYFQRAAFGAMEGNLLLDNRSCSPIEAAMRTSAAPTFWSSQNGWIDGAFWDNNPVVEALLKAEEMEPGKLHRVLSIGSGRSKSPSPKGIGFWGDAQWLPRLASAFMAADNMRSESELRLKLKGISFVVQRFQRDLPEEVAMDDVSKVGSLIQWGVQMADEKYSYTLRS